MSARTLKQWLHYLENLHPSKIDLGLERVKKVWMRLQRDDVAIHCPTIVVAGTNGKGSTIAYLEAIYRRAGYTTVAYTSPHIDRFNERVRISEQEVSDAQFIKAFIQVEYARNDISLSYFEFTTLAALLLASIESPDILLLEVGLGGRLDAVNILQHDVAIVTNISLDHMEWLGNDIAAIAIEKAGIARKEKPLITADEAIPDSLFEYVNKVGVGLVRLGYDYTVVEDKGSWSYQSDKVSYRHLPVPGIAGEHQIYNAAAAISAVTTLQSSLRVEIDSIFAGIAEAKLAGRFECVCEKPLIYLDVAHNPASASVLNDMLCQSDVADWIGVLALQKNREISSFIKPLMGTINHWHVAALMSGIGHIPSDLERTIMQYDSQARIRQHSSISNALSVARQNSESDVGIIVLGSFYTVSEAKAALHV